LAGERAESVARLWLTASGGPFRGLERTDLAAVTLAEALDHPNWSMGAKVTIDSATLMNKGLELIEACHLFDLPPERVEIVVHPPSIVHSMVEFIDGTWKAQLGAPDMRPPIAYALTAPERLPLVDAGVCRTWSPLGEKLEFEAYDRSLFVAPDLCRAALAIGGGAAAALNGLNEALVARYLGGEGSFLAISDALTDGLEAIRKAQLPAGDLAQIRAADQLGRALAS
jgi:1-deoxy-D-xylulose-5-phosphate reductoisomerase